MLSPLSFQYISVPIEGIQHYLFVNLGLMFILYYIFEDQPPCRM